VNSGNPIVRKGEFMSSNTAANADLKGLFGLEGKTVFIPGGYGGLGKTLSISLGRFGANVVVSGRNGEKAEALATEIRAAGGEALGIAADMTRLAEIRDAVDLITSRYGRLDVLLNCVGMSRLEPMWEMTEEAFDTVYETNLKSAMFLGQSAARAQMADGKGGRQVHLLSVRSKLAVRGKGYSAYCATKGGLLMLVRQHAAELAPYGINVNGIAPTFIYSDMLDYVLSQDPAFKEEIIARIPMGRIGDPEDLISPALFFCGSGSAFVTGQVLYIDGGLSVTQ